MCESRFVGPHQKLFEAGEACNAVYIIKSGTLDVELTDGDYIDVRLDTLGPGSVIGMNFFLFKEPWYYRIVNNTSYSCSVSMITTDMI